MRPKTLFFATLIVVLFVANLYNFISHIDFFFNKTDSTGYLNLLKESNDGGGYIVETKYFNKFNQKETIRKKTLGYKTAKKVGYNANVQIVYSKWFDQVYIKGVKEPSGTIFILDFIGFVLVFIGFKAIIKKANVRYVFLSP